MTVLGKLVLAATALSMPPRRPTQAPEGRHRSGPKFRGVSELAHLDPGLRKCPVYPETVEGPG